MVNPKILCRQHLLGEHVECHMFLGTVTKGKSIQGYLDRGLVEVHNLVTRHNELAQEIVDRGYNHQSPFPSDFHRKELGLVDKSKSLQDLITRCLRCKTRYDDLWGKNEQG
jgi:hypothetical protein